MGTGTTLALMTAIGVLGVAALPWTDGEVRSSASAFDALAALALFVPTRLLAALRSRTLPYPAKVAAR